MRKCVGTFVALRGVQVKQFWSGAVIALKSLCGAVTNTLNEDAFVAIIESLASTPLVSLLSSATVSGMSAFMDENATTVHDSVLVMMLELKKGLEKFFELSRCDDSWDGSCRETKTLFHKMQTIEELAQPSDRSSAVSAPSLSGEDTVWPSGAALAKADFSKEGFEIEGRAQRCTRGEDDVLYAHSYLQALFKKAEHRQRQFPVEQLT